MVQGDVILFLSIVGLQLLFIMVGSVGLYRQKVDIRRLCWIPAVSLSVCGVAVLVIQRLLGGWLVPLALGTIVGLVTGLVVVGFMTTRYTIEYYRKKWKERGRK